MEGGERNVKIEAEYVRVITKARRAKMLLLNVRFHADNRISCLSINFL